MFWLSDSQTQAYTNTVFRECVGERVSVQRMSLIMLLTMLQMLDRGMISRTNCNAKIIGFLKTSTMVAYTIALAKCLEI